MNNLDRLLNRAEMRGNLPVWEVRLLIERVKEAERERDKLLRTVEQGVHERLYLEKKLHDCDKTLRSAED